MARTGGPRVTGRPAPDDAPPRGDRDDGLDDAYDDDDDVGRFERFDEEPRPRRRWFSWRYFLRWVGRLIALAVLITAAVVAYRLVNASGIRDPETPTTSSTTTAGPAPAAKKKAPAKPAAPGPATYTVRPNDTLSTIAGRTGVPVAKLRSLNEATLNGSDEVSIGQELRLRAP